jgi:hypothetical protein
MLPSLVLVAVLSGSGGDALSVAWKARAERATQKLSKPGLDACDRAVEVAFQTFQASGNDASRRFTITIAIADEMMLAMYSYKGGKLVDFAMMSLPPKWMAHQPADSKTLSVVLADGPKCAFDLCTNDPFSDGPCAEAKK